MTLQTQQTAELLRSCGQAVLADAHHRCRVVRQDGHPQVSDGPAMALVADTRCPPAQQAGNDTCDDWAAIATGAGKLHLGGGARAFQARFVQHPSDVLWGWGRGERVDRVGDAHGEHPPGVQGLAQLGVMQGQIPGQGVDRQRGAAGDLPPGGLYFIDQGEHLAGSTGIPNGQVKGEEETRGGLGDNAGLPPALSGAVALACANGGDGGSVGIDNFALAQGLALGEAPGLGGDLTMGSKSYGELGRQTGPLLLGQMRSALPLCLRGPRQPHHWAPGRQPLRLRLTHHVHNHLALPAALAAKAAHDRGEVVLEVLRLDLQRRARTRAVLGEGGDDLEDFFFA